MIKSDQIQSKKIKSNQIKLIPIQSRFWQIWNNTHRCHAGSFCVERASGAGRKVGFWLFCNGCCWSHKCWQHQVTIVTIVIVFVMVIIIIVFVIVIIIIVIIIIVIIIIVIFIIILAVVADGATNVISIRFAWAKIFWRYEKTTFVISDLPGSLV